MGRSRACLPQPQAGSVKGLGGSRSIPAVTGSPAGWAGLRVGAWAFISSPELQDRGHVVSFTHSSPDSKFADSRRVVWCSLYGLLGLGDILHGQQQVLSSPVSSG